MKCFEKTNKLNVNGVSIAISVVLKGKNHLTLSVSDFTNLIDTNRVLRIFSANSTHTYSKVGLIFCADSQILMALNKKFQVMNFQGESRETKEIKRKKTRITIEKRWKVEKAQKMQ